MPNIKILDSITANQIAAGEVVERPASVVKELCENSLDAGASIISVQIRNGGISLIEVIDNGSGIDKDELGLAFYRHATSKLNTVEDFSTIMTMGFRGEALASIASVSKVTMRSRRVMAEKGYYIIVEGGEIISDGPASSNEGTSVTVESLFYNTPARYKFLKKDTTETSYIADIVERFILSRPDVSFRLICDGKETLHSPGNNDLKSAIFAVYGKEITSALVPIQYTQAGVDISGYAGMPSVSRKNRQHQSFFVNGRYIKSPTLSSAVEEGYKTLLMKGQFAFCVLNIGVDPAQTDVNVHPQKTQIKFRNESEVFKYVVHAIREAIESKITIPEIADKETVAAEIPYKYNDKNNDIQTNNSVGSYPSFISNNQSIKLSDACDTERSLGAYANQQQDLFPNTNEQMLIPDIAEMKFSGTIFDTYLIFESENNCVLVDQHAAHERILFEELVTRHADKKVVRQQLLVPEIIEFPYSAAQKTEEHFDLLSEIGFECERFGPGTIILRSAPLGTELLNPVEGLKSVVDMLDKVSLTSEQGISDMFYSMACKAAVKAHDKLKPDEISTLITRLKESGRNTHCPHGRPLSIKVSKYEIEKWFKRVVS